MGSSLRHSARACLLLTALALAYTATARAAPRSRTPIPRRPPPPTQVLRGRLIDVNDFAEVTVHVPRGQVANPFTDAELSGTLVEPGGRSLAVLGFCDSDDGSLYRIRFLARRPGSYGYTLLYQAPSTGTRWTSRGSFRARASSSKGVVQVDPQHPHHFLWQGTGEHFFYTGATAYHLLSWTDDNRMLGNFERMADLGANRIRFLNYGRASDDEWHEGMVQSPAFVWTLSPWRAEAPTLQLEQGSIGPDHTRFNLAHWRKAEKLLRAMWARNVVAAINMYMDRGITPEFGPDDAPEAGSAEELLYFRYAVARYGGFSNVMWDLGTEHDEYRSAGWARSMGEQIQEWDPFGHLISAHPHDFRPAYLTQSWYGFAEHQYDALREDSFGSDVLVRANRHIRFWREAVEANGRIVPQVNEEYGYELDPSGGDEPIEQVRKKAWAIVMGGGYISSGEHKAWQHGDPTNGGQVASDTAILRSTTLLRRFFEERAIPYWQMEPMQELDGSGNFGLADPGERYVIYLPEGGAVTLELPQGTFFAEWFEPSTGRVVPIPGAFGGSSTSPSGGAADDGDWVLYVRRS